MRFEPKDILSDSVSSVSGNSGATVAGVIAAIVIAGAVAAVGFVLYKRRKVNNFLPSLCSSFCSCYLY